MIKMNKSEKGVTLISLVVTIALLIIVTSIIASKSYTSVQLSNLTKLKNDIEILNNRIATYFVDNGSLPVYKNNDSIVTKTKSEIKTYVGEVDSTDGDVYYVIDLDAIDNATLNYGADFKIESSNNKYVVNGDTHIIYYLKGVGYDGERYYSIDSIVEKS